MFATDLPHSIIRTSPLHSLLYITNLQTAEYTDVVIAEIQTLFSLLVFIKLITLTCQYDMYYRNITKFCVYK